MDTMTQKERDLLCIVRGMICDMAHGKSLVDLVGDPKRVCDDLSDLLNERFNFDKGRVIPKLRPFADTVLRRNVDGELFLMNHPEKGWGSFAVPMRSIDHLLATYDVTVSEWKTDEWGDYIDVRVNRLPDQEQKS